MSDVSTWSLFAFMDSGGHDRDVHRRLAEWQLQDALRWCVSRGFDNVYLARLDDKVPFERKPIPESLLVHSGEIDAAERAA
jgi:hypothetical protein